MHVGFDDVTAEITPNTVVYPGDPKFSTTEIVSLDSGSFKLDEMTLGNHTGTHIDFPAHVIHGGKTSSDFNLNDLIMEGLIVEVPYDVRVIDASFINTLHVHKSDCLIFKTRNSEISKQSEFTKDYVFIEPDAARQLVSMKVKAVGIDYLSVDCPDKEDLPVHKILLENNILIIENLELNHITPRRCQVYVIPLKIPNMDGLPARVMLSKS